MLKAMKRPTGSRAAMNIYLTHLQRKVTERGLHGRQRSELIGGKVNGGSTPPHLRRERKALLPVAYGHALTAPFMKERLKSIRTNAGGAGPVGDKSENVSLKMEDPDKQVVETGGAGSWDGDT